MGSDADNSSEDHQLSGSVERASGTLRANGTEIAYALEGRAGALVVMLSNSLLTDFRMWDAQMPALSADYQVLRYDTRGHGGSEAAPPPYSMEMLVQDVVALLDRLRIPRVHFVGLSMGGMIGQRLAALHATRLNSITLCDTACQMPPRSAWEERMALARSKGTAAFVGLMTERWLTEGYRHRHLDACARIGEMISRTSVNGLVGCATAIMEMDHLPLLEKIAVPAHIIVGEHDVGTPVAAAEVLHRGIPGSSLHVIGNAAHLTNIEQTIEFDRSLLTFLGKYPAS